MSCYDVIGNIALVKFDRTMKAGEKRKFALDFLKKFKNIKTVLEKSEKIKGRLRTPTTKFIAGEKTKEALHRENGCEFRLNVDTCYFSPRLSSERKDVASQVKKGEDVLVLFGGVAPFAIVIAKMAFESGLSAPPTRPQTDKSKKNIQRGRVVSVELGRDCSKYALENVRRNKLDKFVDIIQGDVRRVLPKMDKKFDRIVMARPNLKDSFLDVTFPLIKKNGVIHYYGFYPETEKEKMIEMIKDEAKNAGKRIKILGVKKAGEIGVKKFRYRADLNILN